MGGRLHVCAIAACAWSATAAAQPVSSGTPAAGDPAVIALVNANDQVVCTASMIGPHTAVTAAHCVDGGDPRLLRAFFGSLIADGGTAIAVADARVHPGFDPGGRDIALLTLREPSPAKPLALEPLLDGALVGTSFRVVGFGITGQGLTDSGVKREGTARVAALREEELVAVPDPSLSCLGDSGGPALLPGGTVAGVVSRGDAACRDHAIYTRVDVARSVLVDPYLAETAPGAAGLGQMCFYDGHCGEGDCLATDDDPQLFVCAQPDAGCGGCASGSDSPGALLLVAVAIVRARRRR